MIQAVIDVGTNSTRLYIADAVKTEQRMILKELATTRLGEGISSSAIMGEIPLKRTTDKIRDFVTAARENGAEKIYIYATARVRESKNRDEFVHLTEEKTGITPEIIPGELEGKIAYLGASMGFERCAVMDIGGGSTELVSNNVTFKALSQKVGAVLLKELFKKPDIAAVKKFVTENYLPAYAPVVKDCETLIGVSGTITTFASLNMGLTAYEPEKIQGAILTLADTDRLLSLLASMSLEERCAYMGEFSDRADIIAFGGCLLSAFMEYYGFPRVITSDRDSLEGFLLYKETEEHEQPFGGK